MTNKILDIVDYFNATLNLVGIFAVITAIGMLLNLMPGNYKWGSLVMAFILMAVWSAVTMLIFVYDAGHIIELIPVTISAVAFAFLFLFFDDYSFVANVAKIATIVIALGYISLRVMLPRYKNPDRDPVRS